jgi:hypothetical protein
MPSDNSGSGALAAGLAAGIIVYLIILAALIVFSLIIYWKIFSKAGYSGAMSLLMFVPIANIVVLCILAFGEWPIYRELNQLRQMAAGRYPQNTQYPQNPPFPQNPQYPQNPSYPQYPQG